MITIIDDCNHTCLTKSDVGDDFDNDNGSNNDDGDDEVRGTLVT